jgi:hypothetical protein
MNVAPVFTYQMYRAIPGAQFIVFEKSGHLPFAEELDAFAGRVESFLGTIPSGAVKLENCKIIRDSSMPDKRAGGPEPNGCNRRQLHVLTAGRYDIGMFRQS